MLRQWEPFSDLRSEMERMQREMNRLFGRYGWENGGRAEVSPSYPALNLWEDDDSLFVEAELPGMELSDLEIYVTGGNQLSIKGERKPPVVEGGAWHRQERGFGAFSRLVTLPVAVQSNKVEAQFSHGVLTIRMPKAEAAKPRRIEVKVD